MNNPIKINIVSSVRLKNKENINTGDLCLVRNSTEEPWKVRTFIQKLVGFDNCYICGNENIADPNIINIESFTYINPYITNVTKQGIANMFDVPSFDNLNIID